MSGSLRALALYDFEGENPGELSIRAGEQLTLSSANQVDGWLEGTNPQGKRGLFPAAYVEMAPPHGAQRPSVVASHYQNIPHSTGNGGGYTAMEPQALNHRRLGGHHGDEEGGGGGRGGGRGGDDDWDDDEWDDDDADDAANERALRPPFPGSSPLPGPPRGSGGGVGGGTALPLGLRGLASSASSASSFTRPGCSGLSRSASVGAPASGGGSSSASAGTAAAAAASSSSSSSSSVRRPGTVGKSFNRFSTFVKSGGEAFVLGQACAPVRAGERVRVELLDPPLLPPAPASSPPPAASASAASTASSAASAASAASSAASTASSSSPHPPPQQPPAPSPGAIRVRWAPSASPYGCAVEQPKRETKFKGMKSFTSYRLSPSWAGAAAVGRRYKHFDWLHARLLHKYPVISVPQLPEKQATGRFDGGFIEKRQRGLALWLGHTAGHPVLAGCDALRHFLTSADEREWKAGKRRAERDELVGANFFLTLEVPPVTLELVQVEAQVDAFKVFLRRMEESVSQLASTAMELCRKHAGGFRREFHKAGNAFRALSLAFDSDPDRGTDPLNYALSHTGDTYVAIGDLSVSHCVCVSLCVSLCVSVCLCVSLCLFVCVS
ncbi:sorting nexin-33-like isoform X2 [Petromyzon marinus]|uniref:sorting nexin-33-like isoform X2 n=1 Tax=Petromyzon marinus TaxID=7757 RepID=UPI003F700A97